MYRIIINKSQSEESVVTIGNFDGLHLGHRQLFESLNEVALKNNYRRIAITFEPLPLEYFHDQTHQLCLHRLCMLRDKFYLLTKDNLIDELIILHFNASVANLTPLEFIDRILKQKLNVRHAIVGHDFKFGKGGVGTVDDFAKSGINNTIIEPFMLNGQRISSSLIREIAGKNELELVKQYLGRNLHYTARVIHGNKMGRKYGVPTINLALGRNRPVVHGIYIARVYIEQIAYDAVASIGKNPTTNDLDVYKMEAHLLGVDLDLYGKIATVEILKHLRNERKFDDLDSLFAQIHQDMTDARNYFLELESERVDGL